MLFVFMGAFAGYASSRIYKMFKVRYPPCPLPPALAHYPFSFSLLS